MNVYDETSLWGEIEHKKPKPNPWLASGAMIYAQYGPQSELN